MSEKPPRKRAELNPAFVWDCDECGLENFERSRRFEGSEEDRAELNERFGVEPWDQGEFLTAPTAVQCKHCGETYDVFEESQTMSDELKILIVDYKGINPAGALAKAMEAISTLWPDREPLQLPSDDDDDDDEVSV